jgi:tRNA threonylcarbamoyladenosine biosynthesis protein TsaB
MPAPTVLAFDTSTEHLAVALQAGAGALHANAAGGAVASATLLPQVAQLLQAAHMAHADLDFIAYGRGPGAFTGLRTACAVAQGLAFGLGKPVLAIDSLLIVAEDARQQALAEGPFDMGVAMDARMDEVYAAAYRWDGGAWLTLLPPALHSLPALQAAWQGLVLQAVAGSAWAAFGGRLPPPAPLVFPTELDRAAALLRLALRAAAAGQGMDAAQALPLYLRDKVAQTTAEREAARAATSA